MIIIRGVDELESAVGRVAVSEWRQLTQETIDRFAEATGDRNPLHVDPGFARRTPFGSTIAHGYFLMGAAPVLMAELWRLEGFAFTVAYGVDRLRFPAPLPVDARYRMRLSIDAVDRFDGGAQITTGLTFEREGGAKPVCVAESLYRVYG
ncbi:MaoC family dehydratase [Nocardia sp. BMG51109]|uniref:MaoC family dehydratase n=1 Tax=Nocardia sp. BMG51109 TaxID=1056816 RepID=UPI000465C787|nr:MaoC family dehydratase [Nocardia sp. BMG51109]